MDVLEKWADAVDGDESNGDESMWPLFSPGRRARGPCLALYGGGGVPGGVISPSAALSHLSDTVRGPASSVRSEGNASMGRSDALAKRMFLDSGQWKLTRYITIGGVWFGGRRDRTTVRR